MRTIENLHDVPTSLKRRRRIEAPTLPDVPTLPGIPALLGAHTPRADSRAKLDAPNEPKSPEPVAEIPTSAQMFSMEPPLHMPARSTRLDLSTDTDAAAHEDLESRVPTRPLPEPVLADRIEVDPEDPDSVAHFLETWARIVRTRRRFVLILQ